MPTKPSLALDVEIERPNGTLYGWSATARRASRRPQGMNHSTLRGEGYGPAGVTLSRAVMKDYEDLNLLDKIRFVTKTGDVVYSGRVHDFARTNDPAQQFAISAVGPMAAAKFRGFSEIYAERTLQGLGSPSIRRQSALAAAAWNLSSIQATVGSRGAGTEGVGVLFTGQTYAAGANEGTELQYFGGGVDIGEIRGDFHGPGENVDWADLLLLGSDDIYTAFVVSEDMNAKPAGINVGVAAPGPGYKYAGIECVYTGTFVGTANDAHRWTNILITGRSGVPFYGTWPNTGPVVSDILAHIFNNFTSLTWAGETTTYPVQQAAFHGVLPFDAAKSLNDLHLWELGVFDDEKVLYYPNDLTQADWQVKTTDPGVRFNPLQGDSIEDFGNGVEVTFTDFDGVNHTLYPSDHPELRDESEDNPANQWGEQLWKPYTVPYPTNEADALQMGRAYLAEFNRPKSPGVITIEGGYIKDSAGHWHRGSEPHCGQTIALTDHPNDAPRLITSTPSWDQDAKRLSISIDNGQQILEAFTARVMLAREAANLGN